MTGISGKTIYHDGKQYDISDTIMRLLKQHKDDIQAVADAIEHRQRDKYTLLVQLYTFAVFEQGLKPKELTWLSCLIGGNAVGPIAAAAAMYRSKHLVGVS